MEQPHSCLIVPTHKGSFTLGEQSIGCETQWNYDILCLCLQHVKRHLHCAQQPIWNAKRDLATTYSVRADPRRFQAGSDREPVTTGLLRFLVAISADRICVSKNMSFCAPTSTPKWVTSHQILHLPRKAASQDYQILWVPWQVTSQLNNYLTELLLDSTFTWMNGSWTELFLF